MYDPFHVDIVLRVGPTWSYFARKKYALLLCFVEMICMHNNYDNLNAID